jgi:uncharacterized protein YndB with AHSA1/START domain
MPVKTKRKNSSTVKTAKNQPVVVERTFNAAADKVWQAISTRDGIKHWFFDLEDFEPEVGVDFSFDVEHEGFKYLHRCRITEVVPGKKLAYTWRFKGHEGDSLVTFELFPDGKKTKLRLTHAGLETFPKLAQFAKEKFMEGWTMFIGEELKKFVEAAPSKRK